jgi:DNA invertase Pin-like site-specific DNA recombinase
MVLSMAAEIERDLISQRNPQRSGDQKSPGRPPRPPDRTRQIETRCQRRPEPGIDRLKVPQKSIAAMYDTTEANLANWIEEARHPGPTARNSLLSFLRLTNQSRFHPKKPG